MARASTSYASASEQTRAKVLAAARALYLDEGPEGLSMRRIAARAGLGTMTAYRHFANKEALLAEIASEGFALFSTYFYRALEGPTAAKRLWLCGEHFLAFALEHPRLYDAMFTFALPAEGAGANMTAAHHFLADRVREVAGPDEARATALALFSQCHGMVALHRARRFERGLDFEAFYRRTLLRAMVGLRLLPEDFDPSEVQR